ncbi:MAG: hypothetical protein O2816_08230 [Planctomycetota bacterium]|nr:hypothetical protein [Planctomycetota bacterium]
MTVSPARSLLLACSALTLFSACASYNERTEGAFRAFEGGRFEEAMLAYAEDPEGADFLSAAEAGTAALTAGLWSPALEYFTAAAKAVREVEDEALISVENTGELLLSWTLNESFREYYGEGYERAMMHACLGLAYLAHGNVEDVLVETRLVNQLLENEQDLFDVDYRAGGFGHLLSAVAYELIGKPDEAYIDYKRMQEKGVGGDLTGRALVRLSGALGREDERSTWEAEYGPALELPGDLATIVVIAGVGIGPFKQEQRLDIPTHDGFLSWSVPTFLTRPQPVRHLVLETQAARVRTEVVEDVSRVAQKNLDDRIGWLAGKNTVRTFLKRELRKQLAQDHGIAGALVGDLFTLLTERADLRAWRTLPDTWQAARLFVEPGAQELTLTASGGARVYLGNFTLEQGETMFVLARTLDRQVYAHVIGGNPVAAESAPID